VTTESRLAQTNVQLIRRVVDAGWSDDDLLLLRAAYELDMWAFTGQFRGNGKTQIAHHVGVAGALVSTGERPALVVAGLAHSLYFLGEFGSGRRGPHPEKRARVRDALGGEVEQLIFTYTGIEWTPASVERMTEQAPDASPLRRDVVAMRVANSLDEYADFAMRLTRDHHEGLADEAGMLAVVALAEAHGLESLGTWIRSEFERGSACTIPPALVTDEDHSVFVPPASLRRRVHIALQDSVVGHRIAATVPGARRVATWVRRRLA
jgi:hypothetical protein